MVELNRWSRAKDGDPEAIEEIVEEYYRLAFDTAYKWIRSGAVEYDEALSTAYLALMKCVRGNYDPQKGRFSTYLVTAVHNEIRMYLRSENKHQNVLYLEDAWGTNYDEGSRDSCVDAVFGQVLEAHEEDPIVQVLEQECKQHLEELMVSVQELMPEKERVCFLLWLEGCYTYADIAKIMGLSHGYIWRLVRSAKNRVKEYAEQSNYDWKGG